MNRLALIASRAPIVRDRGARHARHYATIQRRKMAGDVALLPPEQRDVMTEGLREGLLTASHRVEDDAHGHAVWLWRCDCGGEKAARVDRVRAGEVSSCGCRRRGK